MKKDLVKNCIDIFEAGDKQDVADYNNIVFPTIGHELPVVIASDTHHCSTDPIREPCWIRADTTFAGLKRILKETNRVFVGETSLLIERVRVSPLSGQKTGSFKVHSVPALNDFIFSI